MNQLISRFPLTLMAGTRHSCRGWHFFTSDTFTWVTLLHVILGLGLKGQGYLCKSNTWYKSVQSVNE